jgi:regulation of enolase protein 1 (concanavalin A-like superfamily)
VTGETIEGIPMPLQWRGQPTAAQIAGDVVAIGAGPETDWFADPATGALKVSAPALLGSASGDFSLAARVQVAFAATYDAGALVLWRDDRTWAKLCFEYVGFEAQSPSGRGCEARFSGIRFAAAAPGDLRDGT